MGKQDCRGDMWEHFAHIVPDLERQRKAALRVIADRAGADAGVRRAKAILEAASAEQIDAALERAAQRRSAIGPPTPAPKWADRGGPRLAGHNGGAQRGDVDDLLERVAAVVAAPLTLTAADDVAGADRRSSWPLDGARFRIAVPAELADLGLEGDGGAALSGATLHVSLRRRAGSTPPPMVVVAVAGAAASAPALLIVEAVALSAALPWRHPCRPRELLFGVAAGS